MSEYTSWFIYGAMALVPVIAWLFFLRKHLPKKKSYLFLTFVAGCFSVLPIKLYEKYWNTAILNLEHINLFKHLSSLLDAPSLATFLAYSIAMIVALLGMFVFVAIVMFFLEVLSGDNTVKVFKNKFLKILESPFLFISIGLLCGGVAFFSSLSLHEKVWFFMMIGILEEFIKHLVLRFADENKIYSVAEAVQYSIVVALGFSFMENILYFESIANLSILSLGEVALVIGLRSVISVGAHIGFSAVLGYFYGLAKFSSQIYQQEIIENRHALLEALHKSLHLKGSVLFHEAKMMEGALLAMILHGTFNSLLEFNKMGLVFPFIFILLLVVMHLLHRQEHLQLQGRLNQQI